MRFNSIRARLILGATLVLVAFMAVAGLAVQDAHEESVRTAHFARLQSTIYVLLADAEVDAAGALVMPAGLPEPRLSVPGSGLYANIVNLKRGEEWQSSSTVGVKPPFQRSAAVGQWRYDMVSGPAGAFLTAAYGVKWSGPTADVPLVLSVVEDKAAFDREVGAFKRTLWQWLGAAGLLLLLSQTLLLQWGLSPLQQVAREIRRVENGEQAQVEGRYPTEISALTGNLNTLIEQERVRQTRYKEALSFLAHSLKTPLAVLRTSLSGEPAQLPGMVAQQVARMDDIVQHQLGRAAASGSARFVPSLALAPIVGRIRDSLAKIHAVKGLAFSIECPADLSWRIDEGDAFELLGNIMDNAAKWAGRRVAVRLWRDGGLRIQVDDDGPGFSDTKSILQIHVRGDERVPGHGVGLAVVNELVASHQGELKLARSDMGGARVDITLPGA